MRRYAGPKCRTKQRLEFAARNILQRTSSYLPFLALKRSVRERTNDLPFTCTNDASLNVSKQGANGHGPLVAKFHWDRSPRGILHIKRIINLCGCSREHCGHSTQIDGYPKAAGLYQTALWVTHGRGFPIC